MIMDNGLVNMNGFLLVTARITSQWQHLKAEISKKQTLQLEETL